MGTTPLFHCSYAELPIVSGTIVLNALDNKAIIVEKRPKWADPRLPNLQTKIQTVKDNYSGLDSAKFLRSSTASLISLMESARGDLSDFYGSLSTDYKKEKPKYEEITTTLGFKKYYSKVSRGNQEATIGLLDQFNLNLTAELETDIVDHGMNPALITRIKGYRTPLSNAEVAQEGAKSGRTEITAEALSEFNSIYSDVIDLCEDCQRIFKNDKIKKDMFVFSKVLAALRGGDHGGQTPTPPPAN